MIHISLKAEKLFELFGMPITNTLLMSWLAIAALLLLGFFATRRLALVPRGAQNLLEIFIEGALGAMTAIVGERKKAEKFLPLVLTIFLFILLQNWMGILPGVGTIGFFETGEGEGGRIFVPLFRSANSDLNMTLAVAAVSVVAMQFFGVWTLGFLKHFGRYVSKNPILMFVGLLEAVSEGAKALSFSFRLFGNIFAGEVLLVVVAVLIPFLAPLPFLLLELFVGFMQALVFATLTLVFLTIATTPHGEHEAEH